MKLRLIMWILVIIMVPLLSGCGGGGAEVRSEVTSVTIGQAAHGSEKGPG